MLPYHADATTRRFTPTTALTLAGVWNAMCRSAPRQITSRIMSATLGRKSGRSRSGMTTTATNRGMGAKKDRSTPPHKATGKQLANSSKQRGQTSFVSDLYGKKWNGNTDQ